MNAYHQSNMYCNRAVAIPRDEFVLVQLWAAEMGWGALGWLIWDRREEGAHDPYKISLQLSHGLLLLEEKSTEIKVRKVHVSGYNSIWLNHGRVLLTYQCLDISDFIIVHISAWILLGNYNVSCIDLSYQGQKELIYGRGFKACRVSLKLTCSHKRCKVHHNSWTFSSSAELWILVHRGRCLDIVKLQGQNWATSLPI